MVFILRKKEELPKLGKPNFLGRKGEWGEKLIVLRVRFKFMWTNITFFNQAWLDFRGFLSQRHTHPRWEIYCEERDLLEVWTVLFWMMMLFTAHKTLLNPFFSAISLLRIVLNDSCWKYLKIMRDLLESFVTVTFTVDFFLVALKWKWVDQIRSETRLWV